MSTSTNELLLRIALALESLSSRHGKESDTIRETELREYRDNRARAREKAQRTDPHFCMAQFEEEYG
mgnify:FL=1